MHTVISGNTAYTISSVKGHKAFYFHVYIVQRYKEDCTILRICWVVDPCYQEQYFQMSGANTAQAVGEFEEVV